MRFLSRLLLALLLLLGGREAFATQADCTLPTTGTLSGLTLVNSLNGCHGSVIANFQAASAPSTPVAYQWWADTTAGLLKIRNGANSAWLVIGAFNGTVGITPYNGGVSTNAITSGGTGTAYTLTYSPAATAYVTGQTYAFIANVANTGAVTLNVNSIGAKNIFKKGSSALVANDIVASQVVEVQYDGTQMQMISPLGSDIDQSGGNLVNALNFAQGADVASASTTNLCTATGNYLNVTGTVTITSFGTCQAGTWRIVRFTGAGLTLTHNSSSMILPTTASIAVKTDDRLEAVSLGSGNWIVTDYTRANGGSLGSTIDVQTFNAGGTWTKPSPATRVFAECWGGGGSGGRRASGGAGGGGGGGYLNSWFDASILGATESVTIGTGGAAISADGNGNAGNQSVFGSSWVRAFGGGGGGNAALATNSGGGGGGGALQTGGSAAGSTVGTGGEPRDGATGLNMGMGGADGTTATTGRSAVWGGGGGGGVNTSNTTMIGGASQEGGAGGGASSSSGPTFSAGGSSSAGGNGGAGGSSASQGTQPGGGGGGGTGTSGVGGDGRCVITTFK